MITLDTSGMLALMNRADAHHTACLEVFDEDGGPYLLSVAILSEIAWFLEDTRRFPVAAQQSLLADILHGTYTLDWAPRDVARIQLLTERYRSLGLGLADAAVITCAERNGGRVLTTDLRHFPVVARGEGTISVLPED